MDSVYRDLWNKDKTRNPVTKRSITLNGPVYRDCEAKYGRKRSPSISSPKIQPQTRPQKLPKPILRNPNKKHKKKHVRISPLPPTYHRF